MQGFLKNPALWLFAIMFGLYIVLPTSLLIALIADKAEKRIVMLDGRSHSIFIEWDTKRVRLPAGTTPSALFEENGKVRKDTYLPPARFIPGVVVLQDPTPQEAALYRKLFPSKG